MAGGLTAYVLQRFNAISELSSVISSVLDKMQSASLRDEYLLTNALHNILRDNNTYWFKFHKESCIPSHHLLKKTTFPTYSMKMILLHTLLFKMQFQIKLELNNYMNICKLVKKDYLAKQDAECALVDENKILPILYY